MTLRHFSRKTLSNGNWKIVVTATKDKIEFIGMPALERKIGKLSLILDDMRPMFELFSSDFYGEEKALFSGKNKPQAHFEDLSDTPYFFLRKPGDVGPRGGKFKRFEGGYKEWKPYFYGLSTPYPILSASGRLPGSLLSRTHRDAINIIKKQALAIGTLVPYAIFHHSKKPRKKLAGADLLPRRPLFDEREKSPMMTRWFRIADVFIEKAAKGAFN